MPPEQLTIIITANKVDTLTGLRARVILNAHAEALLKAKAAQECVTFGEALSRQLRQTLMYAARIQTT